MTTRTLKRLERAAMRWWRIYEGMSYGSDQSMRARIALSNACAAHSAAQRKGAKRKGRGHG